MLSLTDMWRAEGSDKARQPSNWLDSADAARFIDTVTEIFKPENSGFDLVKTVRGGKRPGTWAHWRIGLAYAKYLSPEFHMWCNTVVRERMEVKRILGHGNFLPWIEAEFGMSDWTARQFMNAFSQFGSKSEIISDLPPTVLYALAAPSTSPEVRERIVERVEAGEKAPRLLGQHGVR